MTLTHQVAAQVLSTQPRVQQALDAIDDRARDAVDPELLALCEHRIGQLLGSPASGNHRESSLAGSALGRVALAFVEQWVIDVSGITDDMVSVLADHLGNDALMDFVHGVLVVEQRIRLGLAWQQLGLST